MADAKPTKIGLDAAVATEVAAAAVNVDPHPDPNPKPPVKEEAQHFDNERRVVGVVEYAAPDGSKLVVTNL